MSRFYCRDEELWKLNKRYENGKFECLSFTADAVLEKLR